MTSFDPNYNINELMVYKCTKVWYNRYTMEKNNAVS